MKVHSFALVGLCAALMTGEARAQSVGRMVASDVVYAAGDAVGTWTAPFHSSGRDWLTAGAVLAASAAFMPIDDDINRWFFRHQTSGAWKPLKELREGGTAFAGKTITPVAAGLYVVGISTKSRGIRDGVWGCVASYASESVMRTQVLYRLVARNRPDSIRGSHVATPSVQGDQYKFDFPGKSSWGKHSVPAGHVANVAACASFLSHRFDKPYITIPAYAVALGVGVGRMVDRRHWTSDTVLGALFGYAFGKEVAIRSLERRQREGGASDDGGGGALYFAPDGDGIVVGWRATF